MSAEPGPRAVAPLPLLAAAALGLAVTAAVAWSSTLVFGLYSPELHLVFDTVDACVAVLLAYLLFGRYLRTRRLQDLVLGQALLLLAVAGLGLTVVLDVLGGRGGAPLAAWLPLALRTLSAGLILGAALVGGRPVTSTSRRPALALPWMVALLTAGVLVLARQSLPAALDAGPQLPAEHPAITGHPMLLLAQGFSAGCFLIAAVLFNRQAQAREDVLLRWLGPACMLGAFARVNYVLFPSIYSDWIYTGDLLRTAFYLVLLVGAAREIRQYWSARATLAVLDDRRRLARELHDGVIQELAYIKGEVSEIASDPERVARVLDSCDRALDEVRAAVQALGAASDEPLSHVLHRAARDVVERYGGRVVVDVDTGVRVDQPQQQHALARITREAVSNALRHGAASCIWLRLEHAPTGRRLVLEDDGLGFDVHERARSGYGLTSMRERATALPGSFELHSEPGEGTTVLVEW